MKKIFTLIAVAAMAFSVSAETLFLSNPGKLKKNVLSGKELGESVPDGFSLQCMNEEKNLESGSTMTINDEKYIPIKFSNGAQNTLKLPEGCKATKLTIYTTINKDAATDRPCYWAEVAGVTYTADDNKGIIESFKDFANPNVQSFDIPELNEITFKNTGEQPFAVLEVTFDGVISDENPGEDEDPGTGENGAVVTMDAYYKSTGETISAGSVLEDNDALSIKTVYASKGEQKAATIGGVDFDGYFQLRVAADPSAEDLTGEEQADSTPLVVEVKKALTLAFYDRRQKGNSVEPNENGYNSGDNKGILAINQADLKKVNGEIVFDRYDGDPDSYGFCVESFKLEPGTYTIYRKGSTMRIYGIGWTVDGSSSVSTIEAVEDAPIYNMMGVRVNADAKGIVIQNGKKFIRK
ncbi:MAG: hypothetical protein K2L22_06770 [Muribaculaceae bacterium]|nr:hypothetical protein [Muribaculaceae bacterium]